jgi:hypothetical protein
MWPFLTMTVDFSLKAAQSCLKCPVDGNIYVKRASETDSFCVLVTEKQWCEYSHKTTSGTLL